MSKQPVGQSTYYREGLAEVRVWVPTEIKEKLMEDAKNTTSTLTDYCKPVLVALANGEIASRVVDYRGKKS